MYNKNSVLYNTFWLWWGLDPISKALETIDIYNVNETDLTRNDLHRAMKLMLLGAYVTTRNMKDDGKLGMFQTGDKIEEQLKKDFHY